LHKKTGFYAGFFMSVNIKEGTLEGEPVI